MMAGLLDMEDDGSLGSAGFLRGLLGASQQRKKPFTMLLGGLAGLQQAQAKAAQQAQAQAMAERKLAIEEALKNAQMQEFAAQAEQRRAAIAQAEAAQRRGQEFQGALVGGSTTSPTQAIAAGGGPTVANAANVGQPRAMDWNALAMRFPDQIETIKKLAEARNFGADEVARVIEGADARNQPQAQQFDKYGRPVGQAIPKAVEMKLADLGGTQTPYNPFSIGGPMVKTQSPDSRASNAVAWANNAIAKERLNMDKTANAVDAPFKVPQNYMLGPDGRSVVAIPGGPADIKAGELGQKLEREKSATTESAKNVLETIKEAKGLTSGWTTGIGGLTAAAPLTPARELAGKLQTIKANLGFDRLQEMRRNSPTGGALGQVAVQELNALQATVASLDQLQSPAALANALNKVEKHYSRWLEVMGGSSGGATGDFGEGWAIRPKR